MSSLTFDIAPRWRAKADEGYWYIDRDMQVVRTWDRGKEGLPFKTIDELRNESGNYFSTEEEAEYYASIFRNTLMQDRCSHRAGGKGLYYFVDTGIPRSVGTYEWEDPTREDPLVLVCMRVGTTFSPKKKPETFATYLWQPYRAGTKTPNKGTRINQKAPKRLKKSLRGFFSLSLSQAGDQRKRSKRKSLRNEISVLTTEYKTGQTPLFYV